MLEELKIRYKQTKLSMRLAILVAVAIIPAALYYFDETSVIEEEFSKAETEEKAAAQKLLEAENTLKNIPEAESQLVFTRDQLAKAEGRLPSTVVVDEILRFIGKSAKKFDVNVISFEPQPEVARGNEYKFTELPFKITVDGHDYGQICEWLDEVSGVKSQMFLKSWKINRKAGRAGVVANQANSPAAIGLSESQLVEKAGLDARENLRLILDAEFSVYKLASHHRLPIERKAEA